MDLGKILWSTNWYVILSVSYQQSVTHTYTHTHGVYSVVCSRHFLIQLVLVSTKSHSIHSHSHISTKARFISKIVRHFKQAASQLDKISFHRFYKPYIMWNEEKRGNSRWQHTNKTVFPISKIHLTYTFYYFTPRNENDHRTITLDLEYMIFAPSLPSYTR